MKEILNDLAEYIKLPRLLIVGVLIVVTSIAAETTFNFELKGWYRLIYVCIAYAFWDSILDLITKPKKKK
tara:strand:+ start:587 stop:796 length:210 start_codon:yes stop_codon:yes gene_type:complete